MGKSKVALLIVLFFSGISLYSQTIFDFTNPSFEGYPRMGSEFTVPIKEWTDCGLRIFPKQTPPDIHPGMPPFFDVTIEPQHGETYLGLVTRDDDSWESVSQLTPITLLPDSCYQLTIWLCMSDEYNSKTYNSPYTPVAFNTPIVLQIWGGRDHPCAKDQLLDFTEHVNHTAWMEYVFEFMPEDRVNYITLEAYYDTTILKAHNGNILIDNLSPISQISCD